MTFDIYYANLSITKKEVECFRNAVRNGWGNRYYDYIDGFEQLFRQHLAAAYAIAASSCTRVLQLGLVGVGVRPGDDAILVDTNGSACAVRISYLSAKPVFVDILLDTWCPDRQRIHAAIAPNIEAIIAVHRCRNAHGVSTCHLFSTPCQRVRSTGIRYRASWSTKACRWTAFFDADNIDGRVLYWI